MYISHNLRLRFALCSSKGILSLSKESLREIIPQVDNIPPKGIPKALTKERQKARDEPQSQVLPNTLGKVACHPKELDTLCNGNVTEFMLHVTYFVYAYKRSRAGKIVWIP